MKLLRFSAVAALIFGTSFAFATEGLIQIKSPDSVAVTADRFEQAVKDRGLNIFARIDHAAGAEKVGKTLRPTELLIFGSPKAGTPFMQCAQSVGIDLPLKALVWEDEQGQVWLGYNDPDYLASRHLAEDCPVVTGIAGNLSELAAIATGKSR
jgi:uncharacterized protein (DUF302 family)